MQPVLPMPARPAPPARPVLREGLFRAAVGAAATTLALALAGIATAVWLSFRLDAGGPGWQDALLPAYAAMVGSAIGTLLVGIVGGVLAIVALRREPPPGAPSRKGWLTAALVASLVCVPTAALATFWLLVVGAFMYAIGKGGPVG